MPFRLGLVAVPAILTGVAALRSAGDPHVDLGPPAVARPPSPAEEGAPVLRVMTLNLAHGRRLSAHQTLLSRQKVADNLVAVGDVLLREAPDVVAVQEADGPSVWSGHFDHVESLARYAAFSGVFRGVHASARWPFTMDYGTALLGRVSLGDPLSVPFDDNWRDSKGFVVATIAVPGWDGQEVDVVSVHLDFLRPSVRRRQVDTIIETLRDRGRPLIVLGDLNADTDEASWQRLVEGLGLRGLPADLGAPTYPSTGPRTRIDWVLISEELTFSTHRVLADTVSDHCGIVAEITVRDQAAQRRLGSR